MKDKKTFEGVLNIATGVPETLLSLVKYIESAGNQPVFTRMTAVRAGDIRESYATIVKAKEQLGFVSEINLAEGIRLLMNKTS
jgi:nucleoside-diphosphate-sugar epimerase